MYSLREAHHQELSHAKDGMGVGSRKWEISCCTARTRRAWGAVRLVPIRRVTSGLRGQAGRYRAWCDKSPRDCGLRPKELHVAPGSSNSKTGGRDSALLSLRDGMLLLICFSFTRPRLPCLSRAYMCARCTCAYAVKPACFFELFPCLCPLLQISCISAAIVHANLFLLNSRFHISLRCPSFVSFRSKLRSLPPPGVEQNGVGRVGIPVRAGPSDGARDHAAR